MGLYAQDKLLCINFFCEKTCHHFHDTSACGEFFHHFGTPYQTSKAPHALSCFGAGQVFVTGMIQRKRFSDCAPMTTKLKTKFGRDNFVKILHQTHFVSLVPMGLMKNTGIKKCSAHASSFFLVQLIKSLIIS